METNGKIFYKAFRYNLIFEMKLILFALLLTLAVQGQNKQNTQKTVSKTSSTNKNDNNNTNKNANNNTNKNDNKNTNPSTNANDSKSNANSSAPKKLTGQQALDNVKKERFQLKQAQEKYNQVSQPTDTRGHLNKAVAKTKLALAKAEYNGAVSDFRNT